ncbi:hypothetical protein HFP15_15210 [Amycolatopsis sp. K13G38]|uniref:Uncharacterized protein n=1 Tax=Amycolatopsis acididurans TaxID=2724524 RepID=A0ABX1J4E8_9PSEU|nr:hypothetical protein [Amycolatopsis acididurans]NKQ54236.1 hypothetical protein [Amycolatopsis acididurans]
MIVLAALLAGVGCLTVALVSGVLLWAYIAVGASALGLAVLAWDRWRTRRTVPADAGPGPAAEDDEEATVEDEEVAAEVGVR